MSSRRSIPLAILWALLALTLAYLPAYGPVLAPAPVSAETPQPMPPHPQKLADWQENGESQPPFLGDPDFFRRKGINQTTRQPSQISGSINALAVAVRFSDNANTVTASFFDSLIFAAPVSGRGSVRDYYSEVSYGQVDIVTVDLPSSLGWVSAPQPYGYYTGGNYCWGAYPNNCQKLAEDVVDAVNSVVDFSNYDNDGDGTMEPIMLIHAGPGAEFTGSVNDIWSHSWTLFSPRTYDGVTIGDYVIMPEYWQTVSAATSDMTIGVFAHEMGHGFWNLPDLYDVDYSSNGVGNWSLMSFGSWNGPNSGGWGSDGSSPAWPDAWSRLKMGFDTFYMGFNTGNLLMIPAESLPGTILRLKSSSSTPQEYFLLENRQQLSGGYDQYLPGSGLLIWHVDEAMWSLYGGTDNDFECKSWPSFPHCWGTCMGSHYLVALEQADGNDDLELTTTNFGDTGDPFPGTSPNTAWQWFGHSPVNPESGSWYDVGCSTDSCLDVLNIMPSGSFDVQITLQQAYCSQMEADLGDAPDSFNNHSLPMTAYPPIGPLLPVQANFPTVYWGPPTVPGPRHHFTMMNAWLGPATTGEWQADTPPDQDPMTNITPPMDIADQDSMATGIGDDGLAVPVPLADCGQFSLPYHVQLNSVGAAPYYVNAWLDMNRDGDWADTLTCPDGTQVPEWIVQDQAPILAPGLTPQITPPFFVRTPIFEDVPFESWLRLSIAEQPAPAPFDGRGPVMGYDLGETEDYYLHLFPDLQKTSSFVTPPAPGERVTFTIMLHGLGNVVGQGATISDTLPPGLDYVSSSPPGSYDPSLRTVTWMTDIVPNVPQKIEIVADVSASSCAVMTNTATLLWAGDVWRRAPFSFAAGCAAGDPTASFTWSPPACTDHPVQFYNNSTGTAPLTYSWDLDGDGLADSTERDPSWQYTMTGTYTVALTTTNACGCSDTFTDTVEIGSDCVFRVYLPIIIRNVSSP